jgi:hypothetical protein
MESEENIYNAVVLRNIDDEDFEFKYGNVGYVMFKGQERPFPKFIAVNAVKHLIDKMLIKSNPDGKLLTIQEKRDELARQIIVREEKYDKPTTPTDQEIIDKMDKMYDFNSILKQKTAESAEQVEEQVKQSSEVFEGLGEEKPKLTKQVLLDYAKNTLGIDMDNPEIKAVYDKMPFLKLKKELDYQEK